MNLEYLSRVVFATAEGQAFCDTLVGTDSHTTMVNGLGVLGWGVGGIEAEAAMLGQPLSMLLPPVVGLRLFGELPEGTTATDLVLTITELLRRHGVVGKFVEAYGPGVAAVPLETRATIGNMSPEYGATCTIFPIDRATVDYLRFTGRDDDHLALVEAYAKAQGLWHEPPGDRAGVLRDRRARPGHRGAEPGRPGAPPGPGLPGRRRACLPVALRSPGRRRGRRPAGPAGAAGVTGHRLADGDVVIAAITSCTNTSNPQVMVAAGLLAQRAVERGLSRQALGQDHPGPGLPGGHGLPRAVRPDRAARPAGLLPGRLRLHHLHRQLGAAARGGLRGRAGQRPVGGLGALGQPELRGPHPPRRAA